MRTRPDTVPRRIKRPGMFAGGDGSTLSLDFTSMSGLDSRFTYTRNSIATFINSSGLVQQVTAAATNDPTKARFDYDPSTLAPRGLLIEGSATNLLTYSETLSNAAWTKTQCSIDATPVTAPDGATTALRILEASGTISPTLVRTSITVSASTAYSLSAFIRNNGGTRYVILRINDNSSNANAASLVFDTQTGTISGAATAYGTITNVTGSVIATFSGTNAGWWRVVLNFSTPSGMTLIAVKVNPSNDGTRTADGQVNTYTGNTSNGVYVWGLTLEAGSGASSYIPTGASQVQRVADSCTMTGTNFSSWFAGVTSGYSVLWSCSPQSRQAGSFPPMICLRGPSDSGSRSYYYNDGTYNTAHRTSNGTTASESFGPNSLTYGVARKFAISVTNGSQLVSSNGATANSNTQAITSFNQTTLGFGNDADTTPGSLTGRQHFQSFKFWPYPQTQAALNALTA